MWKRSRSRRIRRARTDRGLSGVLVALVRLWDEHLSANLDAGKLADPSSQMMAVIAQLVQRAVDATDDVQVGQRMQAMLHQRRDEWLNQGRRQQEQRLAYQAQGGNTVGLLSAAGVQNRDLFACLNSLRDVEGSVNLILDQRCTLCGTNAKSILLGASNSWFPNVLSALAIARALDKLGKQIEAQWQDLKDVEDDDELRLMRKRRDKFQSLIPLFGDWDNGKIWQAIQTRRSGNAKAQAQTRAADLKLPEWEAFSNPDLAPENDDFRLRRVAAPGGFEHLLEDTVLVERIREVRALLGFTRIQSNGAP